MSLARAVKAEEGDLSPIAEAAAPFAPVSLEALGEAGLMDRVDRKYLAPVAVTPRLLNDLAGAGYRALEIGGRRLLAYSTLYLDTPELSLYRDHHRGRTRRYKVRIRRYGDAPDGFLEIKYRTGAERTVKQRIPLGAGDEDPLDRLIAAGLFGKDEPPESLTASLLVEYSRLTLVRADPAERVTFDFDICFGRDGQERRLPGVAIVEIKQNRRARSPFVEAARALNLREGALSKYCAGIALLAPGAKSNRFRPGLRRLETMGSSS